MGKKILDSKLLYAFLGVLIAIALWFYVASLDGQDAQINITGIPITFLNEEVLEENSLMITGGRDQTVTLTVSGPRSTLAKLESEKESITLGVDVSKITSPSDYRLAYTASLPSRYSGSVQIINRSPSNIDFTVSRRIQKEIPVEGKFTGTLAEGYMRGEFSILPSSVAISGVESEVNQVSKALVTVGGEALTSAFHDELGFDLVNAQGEVLSGLGVECSVETILVTLPVLKTADVPLAVNLIDGGGATSKNARCRIEPEFITVSGAEDALEPLKEIVLGEIDLAGVDGTGTFTFDIPLDSALENISGETQAVVTVTVTGLAVKTMECPNENIELLNPPEGFEAQSVTQTVKVLVRGPSEAVEQVLPQNLRVAADLSALEAVAGRYTVPAQVYVDSPGDVGAVGEYKLVVDIAAAQ